MAKYHFHIWDNLGTIADDEGMECDSVRSALQIAETKARRLADDNRHPLAPQHFSVQICDEFQAHVVTVVVRR